MLSGVECLCNITSKTSFFKLNHTQNPTGSFLMIITQEALPCLFQFWIGYLTSVSYPLTVAWVWLSGNWKSSISLPSCVRVSSVEQSRPSEQLLWRQVEGKTPGPHVPLSKFTWGHIWFTRVSDFLLNWIACSVGKQNLTANIHLKWRAPELLRNKRHA